MFASKSKGRKGGAIAVCSLLASSLLLIGCSDDPAIAPLSFTQSVTADAIESNSVADTPSATAATAATSPGPAEATTPEVSAAPATPPNPAASNSPEPALQAEVFFQPSANVSIDESSNASFLALQRLRPATSFSYTVTRDGARFDEVTDFSSGTVEADGEDSMIVVEYSDASIEFCRFDQTVRYICIRVFEDGLGSIKLFDIETTNTGSGVFHVCPAIVQNVDDCAEELINNPTGTVAVTAGLPTAFDSLQGGPIADSGAYLRYLGESKTAQMSRSNLVLTGWAETVQILVNQSINQ